MRLTVLVVALVLSWLCYLHLLLHIVYVVLHLPIIHVFLIMVLILIEDYELGMLDSFKIGVDPAAYGSVVLSDLPLIYLLLVLSKVLISLSKETITFLHQRRIQFPSIESLCVYNLLSELLLSSL